MSEPPAEWMQKAAEEIADSFSDGHKYANGVESAAYRMDRDEVLAILQRHAPSQGEERLRKAAREWLRLHDAALKNRAAAERMWESGQIPKAMEDLRAALKGGDADGR